MFSLAVVLLALAGFLLLSGLATLALAPLMATQVAATVTRPKLERRASGPDRMRAIIDAQRAERSRRGTLSQTLSRTGIVLAGGAVLSLVGAAMAWFMGY